METFGLRFSSPSFVKPVVNMIIISFSFPPPHDIWYVAAWKHYFSIWVYASTSQDCILGKLCVCHLLPSAQSSEVSMVRNYMDVGQEDVLQQVREAGGQDYQLCYRGHMH